MMTEFDRIDLEHDLLSLITNNNDDNMDDEEYFQRLLFANHYISKRLLEFKTIYRELN